MQPIFYPFALMAKYGRGVVMDERSRGPVYSVQEFEQVPYVDHVAVYNQEKNEMVPFYGKPGGDRSGSGGRIPGLRPFGCRGVRRAVA